MKVDLNRPIGTTELAAILNISRWRARKWLRDHGVVSRSGHSITAPLHKVLKAFPDTVDSIGGLATKLGMAADFDRMDARLKSAEARIRALETSLRKSRAARRRARNRERKCRAREKSANLGND